MRVKIFDEYSRFLEFVNSVPVNQRINHDSSWSGGGYDNALKLAASGDSSIVKRAESIFLDIEHVLLPSIQTYEINSHYHGSRPNISAVMAGRPKSMYRKEYIDGPNNHGPIRLYLDRFSSARYTASEITSRGVAILALVLALKRTRHVTLYIGEAVNTWGLGNVIWATAVDLNHIDLAVLANAVAGASFYRALGFTVNSVANGDYAGTKLTADKIRLMLQWTKQDIIFEGLALSDSDTSLCMRDPIKWVRQRLEQISGAAE